LVCRPAAIAGEPGHGDGWEVGGIGEGDDGDRFPPSPWVGAARGGGSTGGGRLEVAVIGGGGAQVLRKERGSVVAVRGEPGSCRPLFIGAGRRLSGRNSSSRSLCGRGNGGGEASAGIHGGVTAALWTRPVEQGVSQLWQR
jgi:hypothetical protein